jgi:hypothetical protein
LIFEELGGAIGKMLHRERKRKRWKEDGASGGTTYPEFSNKAEVEREFG